MQRLRYGLCLSVLMLIPAIISPALGQAHPSAAPQRKLFKNHHILMALAAARGDKDLVVLIASRPGENARVADEVTRLGGEIHFREDAVDYLRARVPLASMEKLAAFQDVQSLDIDLDVDKWNPSFDDWFTPEKEQPSNNPPDPDTPLSHPYLPEKDMDILRLSEDNPTYDGRGTGVAILDATPDFLAPELQTATSIDGKPIRKIAEALAASDPRDDDDPMWVKMDTIVNVEHGKFSYKGETYSAPEDGQYRLGFFNERALHQPAYIYKDVNFDGNPPGSSGLFGVLWNEQKNLVWVDTNQDHSFSDEKAMTDYSRHKDLGIFGSNIPAGHHRRSVAFAIQTDPQKKYVRLTLGVWQHVTEVSGASLGKGFYGGSYDGVAPGAQLISVYNSASEVYRFVESAIIAAKLPNVDVICLEPTIVEETINPLHDGRAVAAIIFDRIVEKYKKPILSPANNEPGLNTVLDEVSGKYAIAVGAYQAGDAYRINDGATVKHHDNLHIVGSYGPAGDGGLKPEILSPSELVSTDVGYKPPLKRKGVFELPAGYSIAGGTSTAGPTASAAVALLISAAKQAGVKYDAARIRTALLSSARFIPSIPAYKQGNGLIQVDAAWNMLKLMDKQYDPVSIESRAPVKTVISADLATPNQGRGIYEREGWSSGEKGTRTITFVRTSGPTESMKFDLSWVGDDGSFTSADSIELPLNTPVQLPVSISIQGIGVHSAILDLKRPGESWISYQVLNTIVAPQDFTPANHYQVVDDEPVKRPGSTSYFLRVPPNSTALHIDIDTPLEAKATLRASVIAPDHSTSVPLFGILGNTEHGHLGTTIRNPAAGVWELVLYGNNFVFYTEQIDSNPLSAVPTKVTASLVKVAASPFSCQFSGTGVKGCSTEVTFTNRFAEFHGGAMTSALGSARRLRDKLSAGERKMYEIDVPPGAQEVSVAISHLSDSSADLDLYLFQDVKGLAVLRDSSSGQLGSKSVAVFAPAPGRWKVVVDAYDIPSGSTTFDYVDAFTHAALGTITVDDVAANHAPDTEWQVHPTVKLGAVPTGGRVLVGYIPVQVEEPQDSNAATFTAFEKDIRKKAAGVAVGKATLGLR
ncbi:MAG: S8 family serine peptidase [Terriglobia bacterium]|nr:S8 family serine peptidase [Terriglobia bacterium]